MTEQARAWLDSRQSRAAIERAAAEREQLAEAMAQREAEQRTRRMRAAWAKLQQDTGPWRRTLGEGTETHCGMLIEKRQSIAKVQSSVGEHWLRIDQLYPPSTVACHFANGRYVDPVAP